MSLRHHLTGKWWQVCTLSLPEGALINGSNLCAVNHVFEVSLSGKRKVRKPTFHTFHLSHNNAFSSMPNMQQRCLIIVAAVT